MPERGRVVTEFEDNTLREIIHKNYRIVYRLKIGVDYLEILSVIHSARDFEKTFKEK